MHLAKMTFLALSLVTSAACKTASDGAAAETKDLAYNGSTGKNVAAFFTAPRPVVNTPVYVENDPENIMAALTSLDQGFQSFKHENATAAIASQWIETFMKPEYLSEDGTLMVYLAGHGAPTAQAQMTDGSFVGFGDIAAAIKRGRGNKPLKRLVLMVFGCHSGSWIDTVRATNTAQVADELFVITSSTAGQYSYSGGYNSHLVNAFTAAFNSYGGGNGDVTLGSFARDIQRYVSSSTPQYFGRPEAVLQKTLFNSSIIALFNKAKAQGIMPTPEEFNAGARSPSRATIQTKLDIEADEQNHCVFSVLKNAQNTELCSAWNKTDTTAVAAHTAARAANFANRCDAGLIFASLTADKYKKLYEHCQGIMKPKAN